MIKKYSKSDKQEVIKLLRLNTPKYFAPSEEKEFIKYLDHETEDYFVVKENSKIIGVGGINYFPNKKIATICWDIVHPDYQNKKIGKNLTQHRINYIQKNSNAKLIVVSTSQLAYKFYEKMGFELKKIEKDYWAKGFDLYQMTITIEK
jgi:ribosomal protein S18 acetylase RimI-like enzyme